jgi:circularin A/uberolysin family circular bacteriocin
MYLEDLILLKWRLYVMKGSFLETLLVCELTGCGAEVASRVLDYLDVLSTVSMILSLTGVGAIAAGIIIGEKATIKWILKKYGKRVAIAK